MKTVQRVVMFCDCHDFSRLQRDLGNDLFVFIEEFYDRCGQCITTAGGTIIKYIGDALLATFPEECADAAVSAARCLRREYAAIVAGLESRVDTEMEVGISAGEVFEGVIGHSSNRSFDVFGECVNEAAVVGHHRGIALTADMRKLLDPSTRVRQIEPRQLKWRDSPLEVWEVLE
jgi:adenylate cyclase